MTRESVPGGVLKSGEERRILRGHLWAYRNEFEILPEVRDGGVFDLFTPARRFICRAFYQASGGIAGRVLSFHQEKVDGVFLCKRLEQALRLRKRLFPASAVYRWVYGESDFLPGLVIDRYDSVAVVQSSCAFYQLQRETLARILLETEAVATVAFTGEQGLEVYGQPLCPQLLCFGDLYAQVSWEDAQKTGLFLDQRENWPVIRRFSGEAVVLDAYCYHGLWGIHAAMAGARSVIGIDTSETAIGQARLNAERNGVRDRCSYEKGRVEQCFESGRTFDVIVLDPPALAKSRGQVKKAMGLYEDINRKALNALHPDGILITCSCSHFITHEVFLEVLKRAARSVSRPVRVLEVRGAGPDHLVLPAMPETEYLKCVILQAP